MLASVVDAGPTLNQHCVHVSGDDKVIIQQTQCWVNDEATSQTAGKH